jgi:quercetin dioxygenase-like cupin family protein
VTQFIGLIPPGRAPDHFHTYDEVIYVLDGEGYLEIAGEQATLQAGSCVHLPARLVHCLANTGDRDLQLLGVFRPAGSPAEAYYPDGTLAVTDERS